MTEPKYTRELLEALKTLVDYDLYDIEYDGRMMPQCPACGDLSSGIHRPSCDITKARAVIAKTTGEST